MRIKNSLLPKLRNLNRHEMNFFMSIAPYQDLKGNVPGVYYKEVCEDTGMCKATFYNVLKSLQKKGIIAVTKQADKDWDILILDNDFSYEGAFQEGYINLQHKVFHTKAFKILKANEKYLILELFKRSNDKHGSFHVGTRKLYEIIMEALGCTARAVRYYLRVLKSFFSIGILNGQYYITYRHSVFKEKVDGVEKHEFEHFVKAECRRNRLKYHDWSLEETAKLLKRYRNKYAAMGGSLSGLKEILAKCIAESAKTITYKTENGLKIAWRSLNNKLVHQLLKTALFG